MQAELVANVQSLFHLEHDPRLCYIRRSAFGVLQEGSWEKTNHCHDWSVFSWLNVGYAHHP